jgi:hypothetical protein
MLTVETIGFARAILSWWNRLWLLKSLEVTKEIPA